MEDVKSTLLPTYHRTAYFVQAMRIVQLSLQGFKSFAERTTIHFDKGVTAIVGPNGCGKSNLIDAIRWVLGEQRAQLLRSDKMDNLIFNGTAKRHKANLAEVAILFENDRGLLPEQYQKVKITRRLYRDGTSEYLLNDTPCRLKDIQTLLLKAGIHPDSYAIMELSMIENLLKDRHQGRRFLLEQAAGIALYKERKKETQQQLQKTEANLVRLRDILYEVEQQVKTFEKEAQKAKKYLEIQQQYKTKALQLIALQYNRVQTQLQQCTQQLQQTQNQWKEKKYLLGSEENQLQIYQTQIATIENQLKQLQTQLQQTDDALLQWERKKNDSEAQKKILENELQRLQSQLKNKSYQHAEQQKQISLIQKEIQEKQKALNQLITEKQTMLLQQQSIEKQYQQITQQITRLQKQLQQAIQKKTALQTRSQTHEQMLQKLVVQQKNYQKEITRITQQLQELKNQKAQLEEEKQLRIEQRKKLQNEITHYQRQRASVEAEMKKVQKQLQETYHQMRSLEQTYNMLYKIYKQMEGVSKTTKALKKSLFKDVALVSEVFYTESPYRKALERFLQPWLEAFILPSASLLPALLQWLDEKEGSAQVFILPWLPEVQAIEVENFPRLYDVVQYEPRYEPLARYLYLNTFIIEGEAPPAHLPVNWVEAQGRWCSYQGWLHCGSISLLDGKRIGIPIQLKTIKQQLQNIATDAKHLKTLYERLKKQYQSLDTATLEQQLRKTQKQIHHCENQLQQIATQQKTLHQWIEQQQQQQTTLIEEQQRIEQTQKNLSTELEQIENTIQQLQTTLATLQEQNSTISQQRQNMQSQLNQLEVVIVQRRTHLKHLGTTLKQLQEQWQRSQRSWQKAKEQIPILQQKIKNLTDAIQQYHEQSQQLQQKRSELKQAIHHLESQKTALLEKIHGVRQKLKALRKEEERLHKQLQRLQQKRTDLQIQNTSIVERLQIEFQMHLEDETFQSYLNQASSLVLKSLESEVKTLKERLEQFGEVNLAAIKAYEEYKERYDFLKAQEEDLLKAKSDLLKSMEEMDTIAKERFLEALQKIRLHFKEVFKTLFHEEDDCDIILEDEKNPLESRILIKAQPKGKRPLTIEQLSGGEKTLTAISLLFATYLYRSAPFCILDEVDAPLDDINVEKFNQMLRRFSDEVQFILVTHNKRTMAFADRLYGVTMQEQGVSFVLPVDLSVFSENGNIRSVSFVR